MLGNPYYPSSPSGVMPTAMTAGSSSYGIQQLYGGLPPGYASPQQSFAYGSIAYAPQTMAFGAASYTGYAAPVPQYMQAYYQPGRMVNECMHTHHSHYVPPSIMMVPATQQGAPPYQPMSMGMGPRFF